MPFRGIRYRIPPGRDPVPSCQQVGPMLRGMRKASSNWLGKTIMSVVMGVLIISFGVWGIADIFRGFGQSTLAKVGHTEISANEFRQLYTEKLQQIGRQFGRPLTMDQARTFGLDRQLLQQTIAEATLDEEARRLGLGQSDAETMRVIFGDPNFKGVGGAFDPPWPETLAGYFDDHKTQFRAPEYREIAFVVINPEEVGKWTTISDEDAKKIFAERRDKLGTPEQRQVSQIVFPNAEEAAAARSRIAAGLSFEDLAKERGLNGSDVDLGMIAKSAVIDPAIADAAFALPSGDVSQPVQGRFGVALVKIGKIEPGVEPSYESVASDLKKEIASERARKSVGELRDKMEDERGGGASVNEAAQKLGLTAVTVDAVDRSGRLPNGQLVANIPRGLDVVSQAFNSDVGVDNDPIQFNGGYVWYDVLGIKPSRERNLDEVKDQVEARWRDDQIASRLKTKATEMVQKLDQGGKLADEAANAGLKVETAAGFRRDAALPGVPAAAVTAAFRTAKDGVGQAAGAGANEWIVFRVTDITVPPVDLASDDMKKLKETLGRGLTDEQVAQYVTKLETDIGTSINQAVFAQVTGANSN